MVGLLLNTQVGKAGIGGGTSQGLLGLSSLTLQTVLIPLYVLYYNSMICMRHATCDEGRRSSTDRCENSNRDIQYLALAGNADEYVHKI